MRGIPGSGKSTLASVWVAMDPKNRVRVNKDDLRRMMLGVDFDPKHEAMVHDVFMQQVRLHLSKGKSVVADNTHLKHRYVKELIDLAKSVGNVNVVVRCIDTPLDECLRRNALRDRKVPEDVIRNMHASKDAFDARDVETWCGPPSGARQPDTLLPQAIIVDLDGTLALIGHRDPYDAAKAADDEPHVPVIELVKAMHEQGRSIVFLSGREQKHEGPTLDFIAKHLPPPFSHHLFMRRTGDMRKDSIVKRELYEANVAPRFNTLFVVDDRPSVCRMWRNELGLTCFQVNDVEF